MERNLVTMAIAFLMMLNALQLMQVKERYWRLSVGIAAMIFAIKLWLFGYGGGGCGG